MPLRKAQGRLCSRGEHMASPKSTPSRIWGGGDTRPALCGYVIEIVVRAADVARLAYGPGPKPGAGPVDYHVHPAHQ